MTSYVARAVPWTRVALAAGLVVVLMELVRWNPWVLWPLEGTAVGLLAGATAPCFAETSAARLASAPRGRDRLVLRRDVRRRRRLGTSRPRLAHDGAQPRRAAAPRHLDGGRAPRGRTDHVRAPRRDLVAGGRGMPGRCGVHRLATFARGG